MVREKPKESCIEEESTPVARVLKWHLPSANLASIRGILGKIVLGLLFFGSLAWIWTGNPWAMLTGGGPLLSLGIMLGLGCFMRSRPEVLTLGADYFRHELGRPGGWPSIIDRYFIYGFDNRRATWRRLLRGPALSVELPKEELGKILVERVRGWFHLRYDVGAERIELGRYLTEPEREWLAEVIRDWQQSRRF